MMQRPTYEELEQKVKELKEEAVNRQQIEEALRASEQRLSLALQATSDGIWDWDIKKGRTYASARCGEIFGIRDDSEAQESETWASRIHPDDYRHVSQCIQEHLNGKGPYNVEYRHRHGNGEYRWQSSRGMALFNDKGKPYRMVGSIRDISARKQAEEERERLETQLQHAQKMEAMGTLAGGVAHDFNNLLTAIMGNIDLTQLYARSDKKIDTTLLKAKNACKRARDLTKQFITFAKSSSSTKQTGSIAKLIQDSAKLALTGRKTICEFTISDDLMSIDYDGEQIKHVISNLINNASEAMDEDGTITISAENTKQDKEDSDDQKTQEQIKISIQDHGDGIPPELLGKIFDPYYSSKDNFTQKGMGLGLSICYAIIENHNGRIEVESEVGTGTTVEIYLPAAEVEQTEQVPD